MNTYHDICELIRNINYLADLRRTYEQFSAEWNDATDKIIDMEFALQNFAKENGYEVYRFKRSGHLTFDII